MKNTIIVGILTLVVIGGMVFLWLQKPESADADFKLSESKNAEIKPSSRQVSLQEGTPRESSKLEPKITNRKEPRFTAVGHSRKLEFSDMGIETIAEIKKSLASGSILSKPREDAGPIETIKEAFDYLNENVNMAYVPQKYLEDDDAFYFSGGTTANAVLDFSSGIAVSKKDRTVTSWKSTP